MWLEIQNAQSALLKIWTRTPNLGKGRLLRDTMETRLDRFGRQSPRDSGLERAGSGPTAAARRITLAAIGGWAQAKDAPEVYHSDHRTVCPNPALNSRAFDDGY